MRFDQCLFEDLTPTVRALRRFFENVIGHARIGADELIEYMVERNLGVIHVAMVAGLDHTIEKTKTNKTRRVDMSDALILELEALKRTRQAEYLARGKNEIPEWVFLGPGRITWEDGKPVGREEGQRVEMYNVKNRYFLKCLEKAKLRRIRFHDLRHHADSRIMPIPLVELATGGPRVAL